MYRKDSTFHETLPRTSVPTSFQRFGDECRPGEVHDVDTEDRGLQEAGISVNCNRRQIRHDINLKKL